MRTNVYIDASNLFYGGKKSLGWSIDYKKLHSYLKNKYQATQIFFFGGIEIHKFPFNYLENDSVPISKLEQYFEKLISENNHALSESKPELLAGYLKRVRFYLKLAVFGYQLVLKPVKTLYRDREPSIKKANCDVDMSFFLMRDLASFDRAIVLSGDGDFLPVLKFLRSKGKEVLILARGNRTAREIKQFAGSDFRDFQYLRTHLEYALE